MWFTFLCLAPPPQRARLQGPPDESQQRSPCARGQVKKLVPSRTQGQRLQGGPSVPVSHTAVLKHLGLRNPLAFMWVLSLNNCPARN